jgi:hypothetical protein
MFSCDDISGINDIRLISNPIQAPSHEFDEIMLGGIPVPTAWRVLGLRMEERPPDMEVSCEYIE